MLPLGGCLLSGDKPDPGLDIPQAYLGGPKNPALAEAALPSLDWWRGFRSKELTELIEEARAANLDIAAAVAQIVQADAQSRVAGAPLLPAVGLNGSATRLRSIAGTRLGGATGSLGGSERDLLSSSLTASYEIDFWGKNRAALRAAEENAVASRYNREVVGLTTVVERRQCLFPGAGGAGPAAHRARKRRQRDPHPQSDQAAVCRRHRVRARRRAAGKPGEHPARVDPAARANAAAEPKRRSRC